LILVVQPLDPVHIAFKRNIIDCGRYYIPKTIFGAVPLTTLGKAAMPVSHQLMGTGPGNTFDLEGEVNMLEHTVVAVGIQMLHQGNRVSGFAVITD
jgi:hypothetical protein